MNKRIVALLTVLVLCVLSGVNVFAAEHPPFVVDEANLLTEGEENSLLTKLNALNKEYELDIVVLTVNSIGGSDIVAFADDYYDYNGYGKNGAIIVVAVEEGERYVSTCGSCIDEIDITALGDEISYYLNEGKYYKAFSAFADFVDEAYAFDFAMSIIISLAIGIVIALIVTGSMKGQLKSVRMQSGAANYVKANSLNITDSRDIYLYRTVTRVKRETSSNGGGTHTSSSGRTHGGGRV